VEGAATSPAIGSFSPVSEILSGTLPASVRQAVGAKGPGFLTVREVAERLRVCTATVYRLIDRAELPAVRVAGSMLRVHASDVDRLVSRANPGA
jgi:excisionase family DNA binding protein